MAPGADDVVVVGAGPAGALSALLLARAGWRVRVFDRARFPRPKLCGDTLNPGAMGVLARHLPVAPVRALGIPLRGMRLSGPDGAVVDTAYPDGIAGVSVTRAVFDAWLLSEARRAGAIVEEGVTVSGVASSGGQVTGVSLRLHGSTGVHRARLVIGADGRRSALGAALGLARAPRRPRRWALGAYAEGVAGVQPDRGEMHVRGRRYLGIAPVPSGLANVCLVVPYAEARRIAGDPAGTILAAARADRVTAERFAGASIAAVPAVLGPMAVEVSLPGAPGLLLAGDAAGFVDPMTGDGLRLALSGAECVAAVADAVLAGRLDAAAAPAVLAKRRRAALGRKRLFDRAIRTLVDAPAAITLATALTRWWPAPLHAVVRYAGDVGLAAAAEPVR